MTSSERQLEEHLLARLCDLKYVRRDDIQDRASLEKNFRQKFDELNRVKLTDAECQRLLDEIVTSDVFAAAKTLRGKNSFTRDDGTPLNYTLVNIDDWCKNTFEVVSQLRINTDYSHHRYDVLLLINGVPVVQIELKTLGINPRRAIEQIVEYKNDPGNGYTRTLLCFVQLFMVSNRDSTYYFANNNARHFAFNAEERFLPIYEHARPDNSKVRGLDDFADAFLAKCTLGKMISRYMVLVASEQKLLMMRPYQIYAVKNIVECITENRGNGYVWHTTGSGKTLTSFKASTLLKANRDVEKCLFVVDRKDLDRQTREEFNRFQEGCVEENANTATLVDRLLSDDDADKVIVTTIQKLGRALDTVRFTYRDRLLPLRDKRMVFIFDECHRGQFGDNHKAIKEFFPKAQLFGFTGTPIFEENATIKRIEGDVQTLRTTEELFQQCVHEYTITHAIEDDNVLRFHVDYYQPSAKDAPKPGEPLAKQAVVNAILDKHDAATGGRRFNAILATGSINDAIHYYDLFEAMQLGWEMANPDYVRLNVAAVFSPPADVSEHVRQMQEDLPQEQEDNRIDPDGKKQALTRINDPMEGVYSFTRGNLSKRDADKLFNRKKDQVLCSLSGRKAFSNPLMWGYYANGFKGIAIELEVKGDYKVSKVEYAKELPLVMNGPDPAIIVQQVLTTKLAKWKHEDEYRFLADGSSGLRRIGKVSAVYFGNPYGTTDNARDVQQLPQVRDYLCRTRKLIQVARSHKIACHKVEYEAGRVKDAGPITGDGLVP